ncbi:MAG: hypothetical protein Q8934_10060 [Bacillota bacterium]|nr:hypothetical protein [Bacillota bacterium]
MDKLKNYQTNAPKDAQLSIANSGNAPNKKSIPGDSVNEYQAQREANIVITGDEIRQQNENL